MAEDLRERARKGPRHTFYNAEFVVALKHLDWVRDTLSQCRVEVTGVERSADLGLALVRLADDRSAADLVGGVLFEERRKANRATAADLGPSQTDLDRFLSGLRKLFALRSAGWSPTIGKNRLVGAVSGGGGKVSHGGGDMPTAVQNGFPERSERGELETDKGKGVRVGILDTSIASHEWSAGGWVSPPGGVLANSEVQPVTAGHATFVAGLVLSQAPASVVEARKLLSDEFGQATSWDAAKAIAQFGRSGPDVLNLSFVCYTEDGQAPLALATAIDRLDPRTVVVAAAGNHGDLELKGEWDEDDRRKPAWPAALDGVVAVGSATRDGVPARFTPPDVQWIDTLAPGVGVVSTFVKASVNVADDVGEPEDRRPFDGWASWSGTSFSAALVSGVIAARTTPGQVSSREAWDAILEDARKAPSLPPVVELSWPVPQAE